MTVVIVLLCVLILMILFPGLAFIIKAAVVITGIMIALTTVAVIVTVWTILYGMVRKIWFFLGDEDPPTPNTRRPTHGE